MNDSISSAVSCKVCSMLCVCVCCVYLYYGPRRESILNKVPDTRSFMWSTIPKYSPVHYSHNGRNTVHVHTAIAGYAIMS